MDIKQALIEHKLWLDNPKGGCQLRCSNADLRNADLWNANLQSADLRDADLQGANLRNAYLQGANLRNAYLQGADLRNADLRNADLWNANLQSADLRDADLQGANLRNADLRRANFRKVSFLDTNFQDANLQDALLPENFENSIAAQRLSIVPSEGVFIGWKKANGFLVKLRILASAQRCNATGRKCRASKVRVLEVWCGNTKMGEEFQGAFTQVHGPKTYYIVGDIVVPDKWDPCRWNECSNGIHFFMTRKEAEEW